MKTLALTLLAATSTALAFPAMPDPLPTKQAQPMIQRSNYAGLTAPAGPYSTAVRHNDSLYLSGMTAFGTDAQGQGLAREAEAIMGQIKQVARAESLTLQNLVKVTIYVTTLDDLDGLRKVLTRHYEGAFPASSLVRVAGLFSPEVSVEMEALFGMEAAVR
jgi:2-iminobutanoate/2-iminopropanoate deaminase